MNVFLIILSITVVQIPGVVIRYLPFSNMVTSMQKKRLFFCYFLYFIFQHGILFLLLKDNFSASTSLTYKQQIFLLSIGYVAINILIIKGYFFKHLFVLGMQTGYSLFLHSVIAIILGRFGTKLPLDHQFLIQTISFIVLFILVTVLLWKPIGSTLVFKDVEAKGYYWDIIWLIPTLAVCSIAVVTIDEQWINSWPQVIARILMILMLIISWRCIKHDFQSLDKIQDLENMNRLLYIQKDAIQNQADIINDNEKKIAIFKHDMRHNLHILLSLAEYKNSEEAIRFIREMDDTLQSTKPIEFCKNTIINTALLVYITRAQNENLKVIFKIAIPQVIPWNSYDMAILFANTLENAVIASTKQVKENQEIQIIATFQENKLAIIIKNKFDGEIRLGKTGFPTTDHANHGIGMQSILSIVDKYHAHASCSHNEGWFSMSFLFF